MREIACFVCYDCVVTIGRTYTKDSGFRTSYLRAVSSGYDHTGRPEYEGTFYHQGLKRATCAKCGTSNSGNFWHAKERAPHP